MMPSRLAAMLVCVTALIAPRGPGGDLIPHDDHRPAPLLGQLERDRDPDEPPPITATSAVAGSGARG